MIDIAMHGGTFGGGGGSKPIDIQPNQLKMESPNMLPMGLNFTNIETEFNLTPFYIDNENIYSHTTASTGKIIVQNLSNPTNIVTFGPVADSSKFPRISKVHYIESSRRFIIWMYDNSTLKSKLCYLDYNTNQEVDLSTEYDWRSGIAAMNDRYTIVFDPTNKKLHRFSNASNSATQLDVTEVIRELRYIPEMGLFTAKHGNEYIEISENLQITKRHTLFKTNHKGFAHNPTEPDKLYVVEGAGVSASLYKYDLNNLNAAPEVWDLPSGLGGIYALVTYFRGDWIHFVGNNIIAAINIKDRTKSYGISPKNTSSGVLNERYIYNKNDGNLHGYMITKNIFNYACKTTIFLNTNLM